MTVKQTVEITNKLGMHARPAMKLFELMQNFDAEVLLRNDEGTEQGGVCAPPQPACSRLSGT